MDKIILDERVEVALSEFFRVSPMIDENRRNMIRGIVEMSTIVGSMQGMKESQKITNDILSRI